MTRRELRTLRREWRKAISRGTRLTNIGCPLLAQDNFDLADDLERRMRALAAELEMPR